MSVSILCFSEDEPRIGEYFARAYLAAPDMTLAVRLEESCTGNDEVGLHSCLLRLARPRSQDRKKVFSGRDKRQEQDA
jgi:hypothetical protein